MLIKYRFSLHLDCGISIADNRRGHESKVVLAHHDYVSRCNPSSRGAKKTYRIGYLTNSSEFRKQSEGTFRQALRDRGYIEEQNLVIDWRFSKGQLDQLPQLGAELVGFKPQCIVAVGVARTIAR